MRLLMRKRPQWECRSRAFISNLSTPIVLSAHACKRNADQLPFLHYTATALPRSMSAIGEMGLFMRARRLQAEARTPWREPPPLSKLRRPRGEVLPGDEEASADQPATPEARGPIASPLSCYRRFLVSSTAIRRAPCQIPYPG